MENRFPTITQIESILIGMGMIALNRKDWERKLRLIFFFKSPKLLLAIISPQSLNHTAFGASAGSSQLAGAPAWRMRDGRDGFQTRYHTGC